MIIKVLWEDIKPKKKRFSNYRYLRTCNAQVHKNCQKVFRAYKRRTRICQLCVIRLNQLGITRTKRYTMEKEDYIREDAEWLSVGTAKVKHEGYRISKNKAGNVDGYDKMISMREISRDQYEESLMGVKNRLTKSEAELRKLTEERKPLGDIIETKEILRLKENLLQMKKNEEIIVLEAKIKNVKPPILSDQQLISQKLKVLDKAPKKE